MAGLSSRAFGERSIMAVKRCVMSGECWVPFAERSAMTWEHRKTPAETFIKAAERSFNSGESCFIPEGR